MISRSTTSPATKTASGGCQAGRVRNCQPAARLATKAASQMPISAAVTNPEAGRGRKGGMLLNFEGEDPELHYARLQSVGARIALGLRDEDFGQRHFIVEGPDGVLVDVIRPIRPSAAEAALYSPEALPT